ncbi:hypothetical protein HK098_007916 [Nowakowskiella sp. JEL0407]|nr:hypothetical protein HK098_007916 [Nowakowskiella sp. JEL0407]
MEIAHDLSFFFKTGELSDITIKSNEPTDFKEFKAHNSPFFKTLFSVCDSSPLKSPETLLSAGTLSSELSNENEINLPYNGVVIGAVVNYIYSDQVVSKDLSKYSFEILFEMLLAADYLELIGFGDLLVEHMDNLFSNILDGMETSKMHTENSRILQLYKVLEKYLKFHIINSNVKFIGLYERFDRVILTDFEQSRKSGNTRTNIFTMKDISKERLFRILWLSPSFFKPTSENSASERIASNTKKPIFRPVFTLNSLNPVV